MKYQVLKVYNNNVVLAKQDDRQVILVSKGIGFGKKSGDTLESNGSIEKVFHELNPVESRSQLKEIDDVTKQIDYVIIEFFKIAKDKLGYLIENSEDTIREHIEFALSRLQMGLSIENPFLDEIVTLYKSEYKVASIARELILKRMNIDIGEEEQGFIALHLYAAKTQKSINETIRITRFYKECIDIIENEWEVNIPLRTTISKQFWNNLNIMLRLNKAGKHIIMPISSQVADTLVHSYRAAEKISVYLYNGKNIDLNQDEIAYLAIDIEKLVQSSGVKKEIDSDEQVPSTLTENVQKSCDLVYDEKISEYIAYLGGKNNIVKIEACTTRLRVQLANHQLMQADGLKQLGARGVLVTKNNDVQVILGTKAEVIAEEIKRRITLKEE